MKTAPIQRHCAGFHPQPLILTQTVPCFPPAPTTALTCGATQANPGRGHFFWKHPPPQVSLLMVPMGLQKKPSRLWCSHSLPWAGMLSTGCILLLLLLPQLQPCTDSPASTHRVCMAQHSREGVLRSGYCPWEPLLKPLSDTRSEPGWLMLAAALWGGILHCALPHVVPQGWHTSIENRCLFIRGFVDSVPASGVPEWSFPAVHPFPYYGPINAMIKMVPNSAWSQKGPSAAAETGWWGSPGMLHSHQPPQQSKAEDAFLHPVLPLPLNSSAHLLWFYPTRGQRWREHRPLCSHLPVH